MNRYIVPICIPKVGKIKNLIFTARSENECKDKIIEHFSDYSESDEYDTFIIDCKGNGLLIGEINDLDTL